MDNTNVVYAWDKRQGKGDAETSALIRALHLIEARLECKIFVEHMRRMSTAKAALADRLSREASTSAEDRRLVEAIGWSPLGGVLADWLDNPVADWQLGQKLVCEIEKKIL